MTEGRQINNDSKSYVREIYDIYFFRAFRAPPAVWKFIRSWFYALLKPGSLNPQMECGPDQRYLSDVRLTEALFSLVLASAIGNFIMTESGIVFSEQFPSWLRKVFEFILAYFQNAYLLWVFSSILVAVIFVGRWWTKFTKAEVLPRRELATLFIYEASALILPLVIILFVSGYRLYGEVSDNLKNALIAYAIFAIAHVLIFFYRLGKRAGLPLGKRIWSAILLVYVAVYAWFPGIFITLPFYFLPLLVLLYPLYALLRDYMPKPVFLKRVFDKIQRALEV